MSVDRTRHRLLRIAGWLFAVFLLAILADLVLVQMGRRIDLSYETTRITSPKRPDGSIDYLKALEDHFSKDVTPENNAAIPILQALGRAALPPSQPPDGITNRLGMPPLQKDGDYFITDADYFKSRHIDPAPDQPDFGKQPHWPIAIDPAMNRWIQANEKPLAKFAEASTRTRYFIPFDGGNRPTMLYSVLLPYLNLERQACRALLIRALIRLNEGDTDGFAADTQAVHGIAWLLAQDSTMVSRVMALELERSTCKVRRIGVESGRLAPDAMRRMLRQSIDAGDPPPIVDSVDNCERFICLDALQIMARSDDQGRAAIFNGLCNANTPSVAFHFWPIDFNACMRNMNRGDDDMIAAIKKPTYAEREQAFRIIDMRLDWIRQQQGVRIMLSSDWPSIMWLPAFRQASRRVDSVKTEMNLTKLALALELFKAANATYPTALSQLRPAYLAEIPNDIFSDHPLIYARTDKGYTLYSVGPNMIDDGGKSTAPADDLVVSRP